MMLSFVQSQRSRLNDWLTAKGLAHTFSLAAYLLHKRTRPLIRSYVRGPCLDAGSGRSPLKTQCEALGVEVVSIDREDRAGQVDYIADIQHMPVIESESMGTVLCTQVLEHVPRPWDAASEFCRTLKTGGHLILSAPHLSVIHEAPDDYYRYTCFGLRSLLSSRGGFSLS